MKEPQTIPDTRENRIGYYFLAAFLITLPFDRFYNQLALMGFLAHTLIHLRRKPWRDYLNIQTLLPASVLLLNLLGMAYSPDTRQAGEDAGRQSVLLLIPLALAASNFSVTRYRERLLALFSVVIAATILYLYTDALRIILYNRLPLRVILSPVFINQNFSSPIGLHATYLALYAALALLIAVQMIFETKKKSSRILFLLAAGLLLAGLLQLASKAALIGMAAALAWFLFFMPAGRKRTVLLLISLLAIGITVWAIITVDALRKRYVTEMKEDLNRRYSASDITEPRLLRWKYTWELIRQRPLTGYGSGSEKNLLKETYFRHQLYRSYLNELNAHSQYLSLWLKQGIGALLVFLWTLLYGFATAWKRRDALFGAFLLLVAIACFSENLLDVNKGIFFYAFFFSFFLKSGQPPGSFSRLEDNENN